MAAVYWLDVDTNWTNTANWSGGAVPVDDDDIYILNGTKAITGNVDQSGVSGSDTPKSLTIGRGFKGSIGTPASPLKFAAITTVTVESETTGQINLATTGTITSCKVRNTGPGAYAFYYAAGTITDLYLLRAQHARIGGGATITKLHVLFTRRDSDVMCVIEDGATITNADQTGGTVHSYAGVGTKLRVMGGTWWAVGDGNTYGTTEISGSGLVYGHDDGSTWTLIDVFGPHGRWTTADDPDDKTITNANVRSGGLLDANNGGTVTFTNAPKKLGGRILGASSVSIVLEEPSKL